MKTKMMQETVHVVVEGSFRSQDEMKDEMTTKKKLVRIVAVATTLLLRMTGPGVLVLVLEPVQQLRVGAIEKKWQVEKSEW